MANRNLPPPQSPFVDAKSGVLSNDGYQFLMNLLNQVSQAVVTATVNTSVVATGATQATAAPLSSEWSVVASGAGGVMLTFSTGQAQYVLNKSGATINVYPPPDAAINGGLPNVPVNLVNGAALVCRILSITDVEAS